MNQKNIVIVLVVLVGLILLFVLTREYWSVTEPDMHEEMEELMHDEDGEVHEEMEEHMNLEEGEMFEEMEENMNITDKGGIDEITIQEEAPPSEDDVEFNITDLTVPETVSIVRTKVAADLGVDEEDITILGFAVHQDWANECLGSEGIDSECASNLESGYEVELLVQGSERVFRSNADGSIVREEK